MRSLDNSLGLLKAVAVLQADRHNPAYLPSMQPEAAGLGLP